jgi:muramidase (phage lysozyme)
MITNYIGNKIDMASPWNKGTLVESDTQEVKKEQPSVEPSLQPTSTTQVALKKVEAQGYDTLYGNFETKETPFKGVQVSTMTLEELYDFSQPSGAYGQYVKPRLAKNTQAFKRGLTSTPMGKYQIVGTTLRSAAKQMGLSDDTVFDKKTQDDIFLFLARDAVNRGKTLEAKRTNLRKVWEGFNYINNSTLDKVIAEIQ